MDNVDIHKQYLHSLKAGSTLSWQEFLQGGAPAVEKYSLKDYLLDVLKNLLEDYTKKQGPYQAWYFFAQLESLYGQISSLRFLTSSALPVGNLLFLIDFTKPSNLVYTKDVHEKMSRITVATKRLMSPRMYKQYINNDRTLGFVLHAYDAPLLYPILVQDDIVGATYEIVLDTGEVIIANEEYDIEKDEFYLSLNMYNRFLLFNFVTSLQDRTSLEDIEAFRKYRNSQRNAISSAINTRTNAFIPEVNNTVFQMLGLLPPKLPRPARLTSQEIMDSMDERYGRDPRPMFQFQERKLRQIPSAPFAENMDDTQPEEHLIQFARSMS